MNNRFQIRVANEKDVEEITSLFRETVLSVNSRDYTFQQVSVWSATADKKDIWLKKIREQYFICAVFENTITGFASLVADGYLDLLYVHKDWQGRGVASELYNEFERFALGKNIKKIFSDVSMTAKPFFEKSGFMVVAEQKKFIGETEFINYKMEKLITAIS